MVWKDLSMGISLSWMICYVTFDSFWACFGPEFFFRSLSSICNVSIVALLLKSVVSSFSCFYTCFFSIFFFFGNSALAGVSCSSTSVVAGSSLFWFSLTAGLEIFLSFAASIDLPIFFSGETLPLALLGLLVFYLIGLIFLMFLSGSPIWSAIAFDSVSV